MTRAFLSGMWIHVVQFSRNPFDLSGVVIWPILYASIAYYLLDRRTTRGCCSAPRSALR